MSYLTLSLIYFMFFPPRKTLLNHCNFPPSEGPQKEILMDIFTGFSFMYRIAEGRDGRVNNLSVVLHAMAHVSYTILAGKYVI